MRSTLATGDPVEILPPRFGDSVLARVFGASLDASLAQGSSPESSRLLSARARYIVALTRRESIAGSWEHLLVVARRAQQARRFGPRAPARRRAGAVPIQADSIVAAEPVIRDLISRLSAPLPVPARGVAMARVLLTDASSPVYSRRAPTPLAAALAVATAELDPASPLASQRTGW